MSARQWNRLPGCCGSRVLVLATAAMLVVRTTCANAAMAEEDKESLPHDSEAKNQLLPSKTMFHVPMVSHQRDTNSWQGGDKFALHECNCSNFTSEIDDDLCMPVNVSQNRREVFVWYVPGDLNTWMHYDWNKVTTIAILDDIENPLPQDLVCFAHSKQVRVVYVTQFGCWTDNCGWVANGTARAELTDRLVAKVSAEKLDGVNVDIEGLDDDQSQFTLLVQELVKKLNVFCTSCQVTIDLPFTPQPVDSFTGYNWPVLAESVDYLITMNYDMNDYGPRGGFADANSPMWAIKNSMNDILRPTFDQHVPANKLIMGFPWYAYYFRCDNATSKDGTCFSHLPFTQSSSQHSLADAILNKLPLSSAGRQWDVHAQSPYFDFMNGTVRHRVQYDDNQSITIKCQYAKSMNVQGVAFWTANVDYGIQMPPKHEELEKQMWESVVWP